MDFPSGFMSYVVEPQGKTLDVSDAWVATEKGQREGIKKEERGERLHTHKKEEQYVPDKV